MRPNTKENSENKQKCQYNDETNCDQSNYSSRIFSYTPIKLLKLEIAPFDLPTSKTPT